MAIYEIGGKKPLIGKGTWVAPSAQIIGDVTIGKDCFIGFGAIIRGDFGPILIGDNTLIEENVVIHTGTRVIIGNRVIIGHLAMIHDAVIHDNCLVGMKSMICDNAVIHKNSILAEQSLVRKNQVIPEGKLCAGAPAVPLKNVESHHRDQFDIGLNKYMELIKQYNTSFKKIQEP